MYQNLLKTLREDMASSSTEIKPKVEPDKPAGFMRPPQRVQQKAPEYQPMEYTRRGVESIVNARKLFQEKLAKTNAEVYAEEGPAETVVKGFLKRPEPKVEDVVEDVENASLGSVVGSPRQGSSEDVGSTVGSDKVTSLSVDPSEYSAPVEELTAAAQAIKNIESSGGDYSARGPVVKKGRYAGERAMGAYQVMPGNLPQWSKAALGREVSEEEFMNSRAIQDKVFLHQFEKSYQKYGNFQDAASVWFTGGPAKKAAGKSDGHMEAPKYITTFNRHFNKLLGSSDV